MNLFTVEKLRYSFEFDSILPLTDSHKIKEGCFLCIWHADKIPPHIGIIINGMYFSLKVKGKDVDIPVFDIVKLIQKKQITTVFVEIESDLELNQVARIFSLYEKAEASKVTCLTPITEIFGVKNQVNMLSELLNYFQSKQQIGQLFGLNLKPDFKGILFYGKEEIESRLKQLSKSQG